MTLATKPNTIEAVDLSGGWVTSIEDAAQPDNSLRDVLNLLPQRGSSALVTRKGITRLTLSPNFPSTHWVNQIMPYDPAEESKLLICILTDGTSNANNVQVWKVDLSTNAATRLDTAGRTWLYPRERHWGIAVGKKWYGGVRGEPMY